MQKFGFRIRTKAGSIVDNLVIQANDVAHAEQKLLQMYHHATVLESKNLEEAHSSQCGDLESAISAILSEADPLGR
ncbi:MAG: hypothetical protein JO142_01070 [Burkholderiales bacterium]|nr:hypothetical protein [Burkholderiales bacterium]